MSPELPPLSTVRRTLLDDLRGEDDQGLWEIVWSLNATHPDVGLHDKIALARAVVFDLLDAGEVELRRIAWPDHNGQLLTPTEIARLHHDDLPWHDPEASADLQVQVNALHA